MTHARLPSSEPLRMNKNWVARILVPHSDGENGVGTGYPIGPDLLLTARHVVFPRMDEEALWSQDNIRVEFVHQTGQDGSCRTIEVERRMAYASEQHDLALLRLPEKLPAEAKPQLDFRPPSNLKTGTQWESEGFPELFPSTPNERHMPVVGTVYRAAEGARYVDLSVWEGNYSWSGLSGAPVFIGDKLVAVVTHHWEMVSENRRLQATPLAYLNRDPVLGRLLQEQPSTAGLGVRQLIRIELKEDRNVYTHGKVKSFEASVTEPRNGDPLKRLFPLLEEDLRTICGPDRTPLGVSLDVLLTSSSADLLAANWPAATYKGKRLIDCGWSFTLCTGSADLGRGLRLESDEHILIACSSTPDWTLGHAHDLQHWIDQRWEDGHRLLRCSRLHDDLIPKLRQGPGFVYYVGPAETHGEQLYLGSRKQGVSLTELTQAWKKHPPKIVVLNMLGIDLTRAVDLVHQHLGDIPIVVVRSGSDGKRGTSTDPHAFGYRLVCTLLERAVIHDPRKLLAQISDDQTRVWCQPSKLEVTQDPMRAHKQVVARQLLDRHQARDAARAEVQDCLSSPSRSVAGLVAYGEDENLLGLVAEQIQETLQSRILDHALRRIEISLEGLESLQGLMDVTERTLVRPPHPDLRAALEAVSPPNQERDTVLLLDLGVWGERDDQKVNQRAVESWAEFCQQTLVPACPPQAIVICLLTLQIKSATKLEGKSPGRWLSPFLSSSLNLRVLPRIDKVPADELMRYLIDHGELRSGIDKDRLVDELLDISRSGTFQPLVELLEQAHLEGWESLLRKLGFDEDPPPEIDEDDDL